MASIFNLVFLRGTVVDKPEIIPCKNSALLARFSLDVPSADNPKNFDRIKVHAWNGLAEYCSDNMKPKDTLLVEAHLVQTKWKDQKTGQPRGGMVVCAVEIHITVNFERDNENDDSDEYAGMVAKEQDRVVAKKAPSNERF